MSTTRWNPHHLPTADEKTFVVTGGHAGIGYFISEQLASTGAHIVLAARTEAKAERAMTAIRRHVPGARLSFLHLDLSHLASVAEAASTISRLPRLDALILNAAAILTTARTETADGHETVFGTNVIGNFALAAQSMDSLERTPGSRIVTLASIAPTLARLRTLDTTDLNSTLGSYQRFPTYARSKLAQMLIALELDRRLREANSPVTSVMAHPGGARDGLTARRAGVIEPSALHRLRVAPLALVAQGKHRGAWPIVRAALDESVEGGQTWGPRWWSSIGQPRLENFGGLLLDRPLATATWNATQRLAGVTWNV